MNELLAQKKRKFNQYQLMKWKIFRVMEEDRLDREAK
jgi:hypothetical protein